MKNYAILIVALIAAITLSTKVTGYQQTMNNYTNDTINVHWKVQVFADVDKTLAPYSTTNQNWKTSWNSGGGCMKEITITGPLGTASRQWGCAASNFIIDYKRGPDNKPIGYQLIFMGHMPVTFTNAWNYPGFNGNFWTINNNQIFSMAPGKTSHGYQGPITRIVIQAKIPGLNTDRWVWDWNKFNNVIKRDKAAFLQAHPNFPSDVTNVKFGCIQGGTVQGTCAQLYFTGLGYKDEPFKFYCSSSGPQHIGACPTQ